MQTDRAVHVNNDLTRLVSVLWNHNLDVVQIQVEKALMREINKKYKMSFSGSTAAIYNDNLFSVR